MNEKILLEKLSKLEWKYIKKHFDAYIATNLPKDLFKFSIYKRDCIEFYKDYPYPLIERIPIGHYLLQYKVFMDYEYYNTYKFIIDLELSLEGLDKLWDILRLRYGV